MKKLAGIILENQNLLEISNDTITKAAKKRKQQADYIDNQDISITNNLVKKMNTDPASSAEAADEFEKDDRILSDTVKKRFPVASRKTDKAYKKIINDESDKDQEKKKYLSDLVKKERPHHSHVAIALKNQSNRLNDHLKKRQHKEQLK